MDRLPNDFRLHVPADDNYDHDMDDPEFYRDDEEWNDPPEGFDDSFEDSDFDEDAWRRD